MDMNPFKEMLIDAIVGAGFVSMAHGMMAEKLGHAKYNGDQHNPDWRWNPSALRLLSDEGLQEMYQKTKEHQWAQADAAVKEVLQPSIILPGD